MSTKVLTRPRQVLVHRTFAIVASQYNYDYVQGLIEGFKSEMTAISPGATLTLYEVPGAFEIPLIVQEVAARGPIDGIIALGVIIAGETEHARLVGETVTDSLQRLALHYKVPVIHEVLLLENEEQAQARCLGTEMNRGVEAARAAVRMSQVFSELKNHDTRNRP